MDFQELKRRIFTVLLGLAGIAIIFVGLGHAVSHLVGAPKWAQQVALCYGACLGGRKLLQISCADIEKQEKEAA